MLVCLLLLVFAPSLQQLAFDDRAQTERQIVQPETRPQNTREREQPENKEQQKLAEKIARHGKAIERKPPFPTGIFNTA